MVQNNIVAFAFWVSFGLLTYTGIVYPILMWGVVRLRRRHVCDLKELPSVSLIVAAYNEEVVIREKIENALQIDYPGDRLEIVVVCNGCTDRTVEIVEEFEMRGVRLLDLPLVRGKANALNAAVPFSNGSVLCLSDANVMFRPDALNRQIALLADTEVGAVTGDVRLQSDESDFGEGESFYYNLERSLQLGESQLGSVVGVDGGMYVIRRELFQELPPDTILDDFVTSMKVIQQRKRIVYEPDAIATENGTPGWKDEFRRRIRVMVGAVQSIKRRQWPPLRRPVELWQYVSHKVLRWAQPIWLILLFVASAALWADGVVYSLMLTAQVVFYSLAVMAVMSVSFRTTRMGGVPFYFTMSHVAMLIGLFKGLFTRPSGVWNRTPRTASGVTAEGEATDSTQIGVVSVGK